MHYLQLSPILYKLNDECYTVHGPWGGVASQTADANGAKIPGSIPTSNNTQNSGIKNNGVECYKIYPKNGKGRYKK